GHADPSWLVRVSAEDAKRQILHGKRRIRLDVDKTAQRGMVEIIHLPSPSPPRTTLPEMFGTQGCQRLQGGFHTTLPIDQSTIRIRVRIRIRPVRPLYRANERL